MISLLPAGQVSRTLLTFLVSAAIGPHTSAQTSFAGPTSTAQQNVACAGATQRTGSKQDLGCTAGEFVVSAALSAAAGTPPFCVAGSSLNLDVTLVLSGTNTARYNPAFWVGQGGNDPRSTTNPVSLGNGQYDPTTVCSGAVVTSTDTVPTPTQFVYYASDASCADVQTTVTPQEWKIVGVSVLCQATSAADSNLSVPYVLTYNQNLSGTYSPCSILNVPLGSTSKCNAGIATVNVGTVPLQSGGYVEITKQTLPAGDTQGFTFTASAPTGTYMGYATKPSGGTYSAITPVLPGSTPTTVTVTLKHNESARIYMGVTSSPRTMTISEAPTTGWESASQISCTNVTGAPSISTTPANRTMTASMTATNAAAACTFTNTKSAQITLVKSLPARVNVTDQFTVGASTASGSIVGSSSATTSGTGTSASTTFYVTPYTAARPNTVTLTDAVASGSGTTLNHYTPSLTCTGSAGSYNGSLPTNLSASTGTVQPTPGGTLTCTFTNRLPNLTIKKAVSASYLKFDRQTSGSFQATPANLTYTVTVTNAEATARTVQVTDTLPAGLTNVTVTDSAGATVAVTSTSGTALTQPIAGPTTAGTGIRWTVGDLNAGESRTYTVAASPATLNAAPATSMIAMQNVVTLSAANQLGTKQDTATSNVIFPVMTKTVQNISVSGSTPGTSASALPGERLRYCIRALNVGSVTLNNYAINDSYPANTTYVPGTATLQYQVGSGTPASSGTVAFTTSSVSGTVASLAPNDSAILCFTVQVK